MLVQRWKRKKARKPRIMETSRSSISSHVTNFFPTRSDSERRVSMHTTPVATRLFRYADIGPICDCCDMCMQGDLYAHIAWQAELTPLMILPAFPHLNLSIRGHHCATKTYASPNLAPHDATSATITCWASGSVDYAVPPRLFPFTTWTTASIVCCVSLIFVLVLACLESSFFLLHIIILLCYLYSCLPS